MRCLVLVPEESGGCQYQQVVPPERVEVPFDGFEELLFCSDVDDEGVKFCCVVEGVLAQVVLLDGVRDGDLNRGWVT